MGYVLPRWLGLISSARVLAEVFVERRFGAVHAHRIHSRRAPSEQSIRAPGPKGSRLSLEVHEEPSTRLQRLGFCSLKTVVNKLVERLAIFFYFWSSKGWRLWYRRVLSEFSFFVSDIS